VLVLEAKEDSTVDVGSEGLEVVGSAILGGG